MMTLDECLYFLVREDYNASKGGKLEKDVYFNDALARIRGTGLAGLRVVEVESLVRAAERRGRLDELDQAVARWLERKDGPAALGAGYGLCAIALIYLAGQVVRALA